jgi:hypothetical protein
MAAFAIRSASVNSRTLNLLMAFTCAAPASR